MPDRPLDLSRHLSLILTLLDDPVPNHSVACLALVLLDVFWTILARVGLQKRRAVLLPERKLVFLTVVVNLSHQLLELVERREADD